MIYTVSARKPQKPLRSQNHLFNHYRETADYYNLLDKYSSALATTHFVDSFLENQEDYKKNKIK